MSQLALFCRVDDFLVNLVAEPMACRRYPKGAAIERFKGRFSLVAGPK
jgi:hypothetical protein